jgi:outer membrane protein
MAHPPRLARPAALGVLAVACALACAPDGARAEDLADAIGLAYQTNPALMAARADLRAVDERYVQARAALGPTVSISGSATDDKSWNKNSLVTPITPKPTTSYDEVFTNSMQLSVNQPLFSNGELSANISAAKADDLAGRERLRGAESSLLADVIGAYLDVLLQRQLFQIADENVEILMSWDKEIRAKFKVKDATNTDMAQAQSRLLDAQIRRTEAQGNLQKAEAKYFQVVGAMPAQLDAPPDLPGVPADIDGAFDAAERASPTLMQARYTELASQDRVRATKAQDGFRVSTSFGMSRGPTAEYIGHQRLDQITASVTVSKNLYTAGAQGSRVREAVETANRDELRAADSRRQVMLAVAQSWADLVSTRSLLLQQIEQVDAERRSFEGSRIEQRIGLRLTIDVLNAEQEYQSVKINLAQKYHDEYVARVTLLAAMGVLQLEMLEPDADVYRPEASLSRVLRKNALPWESVIEAVDRAAGSMLDKPLASRDALGPGQVRLPEPMPKAPSWSNLSKALADKPALR